MDNIPQHRLEKARKKLMSLLPLEKIQQIQKYKALNREQYVQLIDKLETLGLLLLEAYLLSERNML